MEERLYIDNQLVDLGKSNNITLDIKSNLFRDVSKLSSNTTYTVKLPKTVRNMMILGHVEMVQSLDTFPYNMHTARYFRNGVEVIKNGRTSVLSVTNEAFEISIVWGLWEKFSTLTSKGTTLNQLETDDKILFQKNNDIETIETIKQRGYGYAFYDVWAKEENDDLYFNGYGVQEYPEVYGRSTGRLSSASSGSGIGFGSHGGGCFGSSGSKYLHPVVWVPWALNVIKQQTGISFEWSGDAKDYVDTLVLPLINKKSNYLTFEDKFAADMEPRTGLGELTLNVTHASNMLVETGQGVTVLTAASSGKVIIEIEGLWQWDCTGLKPNGGGGNGTITWDDYQTPGQIVKLIHKSGDDITEYVSGNQSCFSVPKGYQGVIKSKVVASGKIEVKQGDTLTFLWSHPRNRTLRGMVFNGGTLKATIASDENVPVGGYFPITYNLPNIKIIDFIKFLAAITGAFPLQMTEENKVLFVPLATVWNNKTNASNWTRKIIPQGAYNQAKEMEFKLSDYAQHNYYKWKADDKVSGNYDGDIQVENETLESEKTMFEFPFSACDGNNVPMYTEDSSSSSGGQFGGGSSGSSSTTTEETEPSYSSCNSRVLRMTGESSDKASCIFDINMQNIIDEKYQNVVNTLRNTKMIKENVKMSDLELLNFDETKPVYLAQYGAYFAVIEIKSQSSGIAEATMLELI